MSENRMDEILDAMDKHAAEIELYWKYERQAKITASKYKDGSLISRFCLMCAAFHRGQRIRHEKKRWILESAVLRSISEGNSIIDQ